MIIGVPKEIKDNENRIAITPAGVEELKKAGHKVIIETNGGAGSGISDQEFVAAGAQMIPSAKEVFAQADMIMKVKEPLPQEYDYFKPNQILFTYLHLAPVKDLTMALMQKKVVSIAYETIQLDNGSLPLLTPMSEVAGRMSVQIGAQYLEKVNGSYTFTVPLPLVAKGEVDLTRAGDEMVVRIGNHRRNLVLPRTLVGLETREAKLEDGLLRIVFSAEERDED